MKKWKKSHRERKRKRTVLWKVHLSGEALLLVAEYAKKHKISRRLCVERALKYYANLELTK